MLNAEGSRVLLDELGAIVLGEVPDEANPSGSNINDLKLIEQGNRGDGFDGIVVPHHPFQRLQVDGTVDVEAPPRGIGPHFAIFAALDPAVTQHRVVLRMRCVHDANNVIFALVLLSFLLPDEERLLSLRIGFSLL